jgi:hypothetical protein
MSGYFPKVSLSEAERRRMAALADPLATKAARIRALDAAGFTRQAIATFLEIRYQHVRNALVNRPAGEAVGGPSASPSPARPAPGLGETPHYGRCLVDERGRIALPPAVLAMLDARPGHHVPWRFEDGEVKLMGRSAGVQFAQSLVTALSERHPGRWSRALIAERRVEAAREEEANGG